VSGAELRIGDADRETAARELGEHFALGRITAEEHSERLDRIWAARTQAELAPAFADLPRPAVARGRSREAGPAPWASSGGTVPARGWRPSLPRMPILLKLLIGVIVVVLVLSHLSLLVVALVLYVFGVRRLARRGHRHAHWR
jgi:Flp pilus assembly protein TadB